MVRLTGSHWPAVTTLAHILPPFPSHIISSHSLFRLFRSEIQQSWEWSFLSLFVPESHPGLSPWQKWGPSTLMQWSDAILHPTYCGWLDTEHDRQPPDSMSGLKATKDCMNQAGCWLEEKWSAADILHGVMSLLSRALLHRRLLPRATPWWQVFAEIYS